MARIFTTPFQFRQTTYTALVSVHQKENDLCFEVTLQDKDLQSLLPNGKLNLGTCYEEEAKTKSYSHLAMELTKAVAEAVQHYLSKKRIAGAA